MDTITVTVPGLARLVRLPGAIEDGQRRFVDQLSRDIAGEFRKHIHSKSGTLAGRWHGAGVDATHGLVSADGPEYLQASVRGAFVKAKHGKVLRFRGRDGEMVYRRWIRLTPGDYIGRPDDRKNSYVTRALRNRRAVAERAFEATFGRLEGA
jgi:hypothetical protein